MITSEPSERLSQPVMCPDTTNVLSVQQRHEHVHVEQRSHSNAFLGTKLAHELNRDRVAGAPREISNPFFSAESALPLAPARYVASAAREESPPHAPVLPRLAPRGRLRFRERSPAESTIRAGLMQPSVRRTELRPITGHASRRNAPDRNRRSAKLARLVPGSAGRINVFDSTHEAIQTSVQTPR